MPAAGRDAAAEYEEAHIPGAVYFDIDDIAADGSAYPHMVPSAAKFSARGAARARRRDADRALRQHPLHRLGPGLVDVSYLRPRGRGRARWRAANGRRRAGRSTLDAVTPKERHFTARQNNLLLREIDHCGPT